MEAQRGKTVWRGELEGALRKYGESRVAVEGGERVLCVAGMAAVSSQEFRSG